MSETLYSLKEDAVEEFKDYVLSHLDVQERLDYVQDDEPHEQITEIADGQVPVYTATSLEMAANDIELAMENSDLCPDGSPIEIINANIYEAISAAMWEWWNAEKGTIEEEAQETVDALEAFEDALEDEDDERDADEIIEDVVAEHAVAIEDAELKLILEERHQELIEKAAKEKEKATSDPQS